ncbi:hypothetical protein [Pleionea sp. CnH1-48]|uniref:TlpA family protein disulfide reductase n=1 Tax=Pleionea sp. CnH1-48 TaxID=2954494 RepID=UPI0020980232|nr:hypothetical protein [Pleionea sp. CnH1-48]MCO7225147.1 hypothetical protein [Pleionea sp. CnH1-48]
MNKFIAILLFAFCTTSMAEVFDKNTLFELKASNKDKRWVLLLWSQDCEPCLDELDMLSKLKSNMLGQVVLLNTNDASVLIDEGKQIIEQLKLSSTTNFFFTPGKGKKLKYLLDPDWSGELPRSYFVDEDGNMLAKSGMIKEKHLKAWIK